MSEVALHLYDPRQGEPAFQIAAFGEEWDAAQPQKSNCFTLLWVQEGCGTFWADLAQHPFQEHELLFFVPYQTLKFAPTAPLRGHRIQFHANFFCIETHHEEVGCNGVLFNDLWGVPKVYADAEFRKELAGLIEAMQCELRDAGLAHTEVLISYLKILLVRASRIKLRQQEVAWEPQGKRPAVIDELRQLVEENYRTLHRPSEYAALLCMTPKALAKIVATHFHTTPTELIRERILREAKWQLLHTLTPVKQIAHALGFDDVFYFSRLFKRAVGYSPTFFREYETAIRGGRNLSIPGRDPSIPP
ncbi:MAG: helix-turn-helix transcriptional regulator [Actinomycetota bacterium]